MSSIDKKMAYSEAVAELESIISNLSSGSVDIDSLPENVKRGAELIAHCKSKLKETEESVAKLFEKQQ